MKNIALILLCFIQMLTACAQENKIVKGYAYSRQVLSGVAPNVVIDETGKTTKEIRTPNVHFYIYAEVKGASSFKVKSIWIRGEKHSATAEDIRSLPVVLSYGNPNPYNPSDTLVKRTSNKVLKVNPVATSNSTGEASSPSRTLLRNEVIIGYEVNKKIYWYAIPHIVALRPLTLQ